VEVHRLGVVLPAEEPQHVLAQGTAQATAAVICPHHQPMQRTHAHAPGIMLPGDGAAYDFALRRHSEKHPLRIPGGGVQITPGEVCPGGLNGVKITNAAFQRSPGGLIAALIGADGVTLGQLHFHGQDAVAPHDGMVKGNGLVQHMLLLMLGESLF